MAEIKVAIAGEDAVSATERLLEIPGISGNYQIWEEVKREGVSATIAKIVSVADESIAIGEQIRNWYLEYKQNNSRKKVVKVLMLGQNGRKLLLEGAKAEQIQQFLQD